MFDDLVKALRDHGVAQLEVTEDRSVRSCRTKLIEAARTADVRIAMKRVVERDPDFEKVVATVLSPEEAEKQQERDVIFRSVNRIRTGLDILTSGQIDTTPINDEVLDLKDIADELEEYARQISGGARGGSPFIPDAAPASPGEST